MAIKNITVSNQALLLWSFLWRFWTTLFPVSGCISSDIKLLHRLEKETLLVCLNLKSSFDEISTKVWTIGLLCNITHWFLDVFWSLKALYHTAKIAHGKEWTFILKDYSRWKSGSYCHDFSPRIWSMTFIFSFTPMIDYSVCAVFCYSTAHYANGDTTYVYTCN
jgi:hypothetical protein